MQTLLLTGATGALAQGVIPRLERDYRCVPLRRDGSDDIAQLAPVYGLISLAGGFALGSSPDDYAKMLDANLISFVRALDRVRPHLADGGRIVAISSIASIEQPPGLSAYVASKAALNSAIVTTSKELASRRITVNALLPSALDTPPMRASTPRDQLVPLDRVAETIAFLLSDAAASISGQLIALRA